MLVGQIMSQKIVTISPDKGVGQALKLMQKHQIRHLPVITRNRMVGWITSRDLREILLASMLEEIKVGDVMVQAPISVTADTEVEEAARLIHEHKIGGMPVMEGDKLVGVITMLDLISAFIAMLGLLKSSSRLDLLLENRSEAWTRPPASSKRRAARSSTWPWGPPRTTSGLTISAWKKSTWNPSSTP